MSIQLDLDVYIRARYPLIWLVTAEEARALKELKALAAAQKKRIFAWSGTQGVSNLAMAGKSDRSQRDPLALLDSILQETEPAIWVLRDFHPFLKDASVVRTLRETAFALQASTKTVILLGAVLNIPVELEKEITVVDFSLPNADQLSEQLEAIIAGAQSNGHITVDLDKRHRARLIQACRGLTASEASNALAKAIVQAGGALDDQAIDVVTTEKQQIIRKSGLLEFYASEDRLNDVGGLGALKEWLR